MESSRPRSDGIASAGAIFALAVIGVIATGGYLISQHQVRAGWTARQANIALYTAEAGLSVALANWRNEGADTIRPGATVVLESGQLATGTVYTVRITRLDAGQDPRATYYLFSSTGRSGGPFGGHRRLGLVTRVRRFDDACCRAALQSRGAVRLDGSSEINGLDLVPPGWGEALGPCQNLPLVNGQGIAASDLGRVSRAGASRVIGEPSMAELRPGAKDVLYRELVSYADLEYAAGALVTSTTPVFGENGECARGEPNNWGAPLDRSHPCFNYFPIIHVAGDLYVDFAGAGQGVLLVDGNFDLSGGYEFYGVVIARGAIRAGGASRIFGGAMTLNENLAENSIAGGAQIQRSTCAVRRALTRSRLSAPRPLAQRGWLELLE